VSTEVFRKQVRVMKVRTSLLSKLVYYFCSINNFTFIFFSACLLCTMFKHVRIACWFIHRAQMYYSLYFLLALWTRSDHCLSLFFSFIFLIRVCVVNYGICYCIHCIMSSCMCYWSVNLIQALPCNTYHNKTIFYVCLGLIMNKVVRIPFLDLGTLVSSVFLFVSLILLLTKIHTRRVLMLRFKHSVLTRIWCVSNMRMPGCLEKVLKRFVTGLL